GGQSNDATAFIEVIELPAIQVDLGQDIEPCMGQSVTLDAGHLGSIFQWSDNSTSQAIAVTASGEYSVTVSNGTNCPGRDSVALSFLPVIHISLAGDTEICENQHDSILIINDAPFPVTIEVTPDQDSPFL